MKKILLALALLLAPSAAFAQCNGIFPTGTFCGNLSGSNAPGGPIPLSISGIVGPGSTTVNDIVTWNNTLGTVVADSGVSLGSQAQSLFLATPSGGSGVPTFRTIVASDLPSSATCFTVGAFSVGIGGSAQCSNVAGSAGTLTGGPFTLTATTNGTQSLVTIGDTGSTSPINGPIINNSFKFTNKAAVTPTGADPPFLTGFTTPVRGYIVSGGANVNSLNVGGYFRSDFSLAGVNTVSGDVFGVVSIGYGSISGPSGGGVGIGGANIVGWLNNNASWGYVAGAWFEVGLNPTYGGSVAGGTAVNKFGIRITNDSTSQGSTNDAMIMGETNAGFGSNAGKFKDGILLGIAGGNLAPISDTGNLINAGIQATLADVLHFPTTTISGNILNFPNVAIAGSGAAVFGAGTAATPAGAGNIKSTCTSCGQSVIAGGTTSGTDGLTAQDSASANLFFAGVSESAVGGTRFGFSNNNTAQLVAQGANNLALLVGTLTNVPIIFGSNNAEVFRVSGTTIRLASSTALNWNTTDVILGDGGAGILRQGGGDSASPQPQTNQVVSVVAGTNNTAGANWALKASASTGSANGGSFIVQVTPAGGAGSSQNTYSTAFQITGAGVPTFPLAALGVSSGGTNCTAPSGTCLDNITNFGSTGLIARTGAGTYAARTLQGGAGITVTNPDGVAGNPSIAVVSLNTNSNFVLGAGTASNLVAGATDYAGFGAICGSALEANCLVPISVPATMKNFYATAPNAPGAGQTYTFTLRRNLGNTSITCVISGASATTCNDTTHTQAYSAADTIDVQMVASAGAANASGISFALTAVTVSP